MNINSFTRREIEEGLLTARYNQPFISNPVRVLFSPVKIDRNNFDAVCNTYKNINKDDFDTVVIIESAPGPNKKKLQMPSNKTFVTPLGEVQVNDRLRNDLCDEDDDFFIEDETYSESLSLYNQLMMLQCTLDDFTVLSLQITEESSFIIKELAFALEHVLAAHNALIVFCCDLTDYNGQLNSIIQMVRDRNMAGLMNYLNSDEKKGEGIGAFFAGLLVADEWNLRINFKLNNSSEAVSAFAEIQKQPIFG